MSIAQAVFPVTLKLGCFSVIRSPSLSCEQRCLAYYILQWSPIFVTSCISGHYWMKLLYSRPTKQPPTFLKNTASSAHYDMANDIPSGHLLCCNFPLVWHAPPILWTPFIVGPFYIHLRPPIRTYRKLNCMKLMKGVVLLDSEEKLPHFVWRPCGWVCRISAVDLKTNMQRKP